jgi:hypothetical protein
MRPSTTRSPAYQLIPGQARCEGFFDKTVSQTFVELVSLTRGLPPVAEVTGGSPALQLVIHANMKGPVRLVVQPQRSSPFYRVDAAMQGGLALTWDAGPMLRETGLALPDLGFIAMVDTEPASPGTITAIAPVAFTPGAQQNQRVFAVVRASVDISSLAWRAQVRGSAASTAAEWVEVPNSQKFAWQRITLPIELPVDGNGLRVDVQAVSAIGAQALPLLSFTVVGTGDGKP